MTKKHKKIKTRRTWTRNPKTQVVPNRKKDELLRGQKITEEDMDDFMEDFERGIK
jgi:hypothetical protein